MPTRAELTADRDTKATAFNTASTAATTALDALRAASDAVGRKRDTVNLATALARAAEASRSVSPTSDENDTLGRALGAKTAAQAGLAAEEERAAAALAASTA